MANPISNPVDFVMLAGQRSPGICTIEGANSPRRLIERRGFGLSGATVRFAGIQLSHFKLSLKLINSQHWDDWNEWRTLVEAPPIGDREHALDVEHPFLADLGITSVLVEDVKQPVQTDNGEWTIEIALCEFRNPQPALGAPAGTTNGPPESALDYQIRVREQTFHALEDPQPTAGAVAP